MTGGQIEIAAATALLFKPRQCPAGRKRDDAVAALQTLLERIIMEGMI